jgi:hypothetical protein
MTFHYCDNASFLLQLAHALFIFRLTESSTRRDAMFAALVLTALVTAAPLTSTPGAEPPAAEQRDVAYEEIAEGRTAEAIRALEARLEGHPGDPALLINLGAAYAREGDAGRAETALRAAIGSNTRYDVELSDGTWDDSRHAARRALVQLQGRSQLAALDH